MLRRLGRAAVQRERDQQRASVRRAERDALRQGRRSTTTSSAAPRDAVNPARTGTKVAALHTARARAGRERHVRAAADVGRGPRRRRSTAKPLGAGFDRVFERAARRGRRVLRDADRRLARRRRRQRHAPGAGRACSGASSTTTTTSTAGCASTASNPWSVHARQAGVRNAAWFHIDRRRRHLDARQVGVPVVRGLGPRLHTAPLSLVDLDFAKEQLELLLHGPLPAPQRPDPGVRVELRRRQPAACTPGRRCTSTSARGDPR